VQHTVIDSPCPGLRPPSQERSFAESSAAHAAWRREAQRREASLEAASAHLGSSLAFAQRRLAEKEALTCNGGGVGDDADGMKLQEALAEVGVAVGALQ